MKQKQHPITRSILIALAYLISFLLFGMITKQFELLPGFVTRYMPVGLTYALLLVFGIRFTPAVVFALFLSSLFVFRLPQPPYQLFLWALITTLIYALAALFLRKLIHFDWQLKKLWDVTWLVFTVVFVSALLSVLSVSIPAADSGIPGSEIMQSIFRWWIDETVGVLTITPFMLIYIMPGLKRFVDGQPAGSTAHRSFPLSPFSTIGQAASLLIVLYFVFGVHVLDEYHPMYLISLPIIWIALQRGLKGVSAGILVLNFGVVLAMWVFQFDPARLAELELLMIIISIVGLLMGAVVTERKLADHQIREREKELGTMFAVSIILEREDITQDEIYQELANILPAGWQYPEITCARLTVFGSEFCTKNFRESAWMQSAPIIVDKSTIGKIEVGYLEKRPDEAEGPFLQEERELINDIAERMGRQIERKRSENELRESKALFETVVENIPLTIFLKEAEDLRFVLFNRAGEELLGYDRKMLLGKNNLDLFPPEQADNFKTTDREVLDGEAGILDIPEEPIQTARKGQRLLHTRKVSIRGTNGITKYLLGISEDITERKLAEDEIKKQLAELQRWQAATLGRENRILELKHEVNQLLADTKKLPHYPSAESQDEMEK